MDSPRRQRSISVCQPHSTTPHHSRVEVPTWLPEYPQNQTSNLKPLGSRMILGVVHPRLEARGRPFPRSPWSRSRVNLRVLRPLTWGSEGQPSPLRLSRSSGHFTDFRWSGSPLLAHGSPLHGDWFPTPTGLLLGAVGLPSHPMSHSPMPHPVTGPFPASRGLSSLPGCCAALATRPSLSRPLFPSSRVYTPPGRQQPCGAGPLDFLPSGDRFVRLARVAPFPPPPLSPVLRPRYIPLGCCAAQTPISSRVYTPTGRQQPCGAGPLDPHRSRGPCRACSTGRVPPAPAPYSCAAFHAVLVPWGRPVVLATILFCPVPSSLHPVFFSAACNPLAWAQKVRCLPDSGS